jgi:hypothetical protein
MIFIQVPAILYFLKASFLVEYTKCLICHQLELKRVHIALCNNIYLLVFAHIASSHITYLSTNFFMSKKKNEITSDLHILLLFFWLTRSSFFAGPLYELIMQRHLYRWHIYKCIK